MTELESKIGTKIISGLIAQTQKHCKLKTARKEPPFAYGKVYEQKKKLKYENNLR